MAAKNLILITSPPACGKTTLAKQLAMALKESVYLDKDTLIPLSKKIFEVAGEPYNRSSAFFEQHIRDVEYEVILNLAFEAIQFDSHVIINAPFSREIRDSLYVAQLREKLSAINGELKVIWIACPPEIARQRMIARNSDRDTWKLQNWDQYIQTENFNPPEIDDLLIHRNSTPEETETSIAALLSCLC